MIGLIYQYYNLQRKFKNFIYTKYYSKLLKSNFGYLQYPISINGIKHIVIGNGFRAKEGLKIDVIADYQKGKQKFSPSLQIGVNVSFQRNIHIGCCGSMIIGDNCLFGSNITIIDHNHGDFSSHMDMSIPFYFQPLTIKDIRIGKNCWVGENVCILPGVTIGNNCVVGANSVVTKTFKENGLIIAGNPARVIKKVNNSTGSWEKQYESGVFL